MKYFIKGIITFFIAIIMIPIITIGFVIVLFMELGGDTTAIERWGERCGKIMFYFNSDKDGKHKN